MMGDRDYVSGVRVNKLASGINHLETAVLIACGRVDKAGQMVARNIFLPPVRYRLYANNEVVLRNSGRELTSGPRYHI